MPEGSNDVAKDIYLAILAAARNDNQTAGDLLRKAWSGMAESVLSRPGSVVGGAHGPGPGRQSYDRGPTLEPEDYGEE